MITLELDAQYASELPGLPAEQALAGWIVAALEYAGWQGGAAQLTVRIVDQEEGRALNRTWRHKDQPTNVLSFPFEPMPGVELPLLGDLVICAPVVRREALDQGKAELAHWAHLVVHGVLHLLGYDHQAETEADEMEALETAILSGLGYPDPYY
jgi:probable rRNA maturation factor